MDHDRLFKELIRTFFVEFVDLFLPDVARYIDRGSIQFLDKEIFTDLTGGERHEVDLIVKCRFRDGRGDVFFLIHIETQASRKSGFARRIFHYFAILDRHFHLPVYPVAIFSFDTPRRPEPDRYTVRFPGRHVLDFRFRAIQLNRLNWRDFIRNPNPVASALMTKMKIAKRDRPRVKLECLRMLVTLRLDKARSTLISAFMESYLRLSAAENQAYNRALTELEPREREAVMQLTNEWIEKGREEGQRSTVLKLLRFRFAKANKAIAQKVAKLSDTDLDEFAKALFGFENVAQARRWLETRGE
jgi:hypothetical protein